MCAVIESVAISLSEGAAEFNLVLETVESEKLEFCYEVLYPAVGWSHGGYNTL